MARIHKTTHTKNFNNPDDYDGVGTHLQPDILECEVKWALGSIAISKATGSDGIPVELFQILNGLLLKYCIQYASKFEKLSRAIGPEMVSFQPIPKKGNVKNVFKLLHNCVHFTCQQGNAQNPSSSA